MATKPPRGREDRVIRVADLKEQLRNSPTSPFLLCQVCGNTRSANKGSHRDKTEQYVFKCCRKYMVYAIRETRILTKEEVE